MEDKLISFETAKLAKEKGFKLGIGWHGHGDKFYYEGQLTDNFRGDNPCAPTQSLLQRWLREKHNLHIILNTSINTNGKVTFYCNTIKFGKNLYKSMFRSKSLIYTYEEALELGLQEGLKLIK